MLGILKINIGTGVHDYSYLSEHGDFMIPQTKLLSMRTAGFTGQGGMPQCSIAFWIAVWNRMYFYSTKSDDGFST